MDESERGDPGMRRPIEAGPDPDRSTGEERGAAALDEPGENGQDGKPLPVVGIGASAGGLVALQGFFGALPAETGMAFVVVTHMDPERESLLPELLQKYTRMTVQQVGGLVSIEANHVYVIPPGQRILVTDKHFDVEGFDEPRGQRMPIDYFFRTLATVHQEAVAIILSGGGTDGAVGVKAVKEQGGLLMVQHPGEAEYDSMPRAAINTGLADVVLPVAELAEKLVAYRRNGVQVPQNPEALTAEELETVYRILTQVQVHTGHDFSQYRRSTILRRIQRRMQLHGYMTLDAYLGYLRREPAEGQALFNDLLIGVTNFFRDQESWQALAEPVIPRLFEGKEPDEAVRVWSIGCATGEEAFSLGMLLLEQREALDLPYAARPGIQVFASDLDDSALQRAREAIYPEAIEADVSPERLARFFVKEGHYYRVKQELRDVVLFSNHNVLRDPPFSRLDLISCRNLLIYLNRDLQEKVFQIFQYALNPEHPFLGSSESAETAQGLFRTMDKAHRIFQARPWRGEHAHIPTLPLTVRISGSQRPVTVTAGRRGTSAEPVGAATVRLHQTMLEEAAPPSVLVDDNYHIVHISETAGRYLLHRRGVVSADLLKLVRPELQFELRTALLQAFEQNKAVLSQAVFVQFNGAPNRVVLAVRPASGKSVTGESGTGPAPEQLALVFFLEDTATELGLEAGAERERPLDAGAEPGAGSQRDPLLTQLEGEVQHLRERLQASTAEYESSNEELKAANEELQSINEEYRSTTEELETSKEELQSLNEELQTVNAELKTKLEEISQAHSDLENLMVATDIATLFLDQSLRIQRYTPKTAELFNIMPGDRGRPISHLTNRLDYEDLARDAARVLHTLVPIEREVQDLDGRWHLARLRPYRSVDNRIDGVVLTFVDIDALKSAEEALRSEKQFSEKLVHTVREGMLVLKPDLTVEFANEPFFAMFGVDRQQTLGRHVYDLGNGQWDFPELRLLLQEMLARSNVVNDYRVEREFGAIGHRALLLNARRFDQMQRILLAIEDITAYEQAQQELRENEARYRTLVTFTSEVLYVMSPDWREMRRLSGQGFLADTDEPSSSWPEKYILPEDQPRVNAAIEEAIRTKSARIAQVLHDDLQQQLYGLQIQLEFLRAEASGALLQEIAGMETFLIGAMDTARQLSVDLSPPILEGEGLGEAIHWLASQMRERYQLHVRVEADQPLPLVPRDRRVLLFQMVRELLFNVVKHANVSAVLVTLNVVDDPEIGQAYRIDVVDQGAGIDPDAVLRPDSSSRGRGLMYIRERLRLIGGRLEMAAEPGGGTRATIFSPCAQGASARQ